MLKLFFKTAWRNLIANKSFSIINIMGLAMGMGCTLFILLWVNDERSYDKIHDNYKSVYQVMANWNFNGQINTGNSVVFPLASALQDGYTQVEKATVTRINSRVVLSHGEKKLTRQGLTVSEDYFDIFSWKFIKGNAADALADPSSVILTSSTATALFGKGNPMNQFVTFDNGTTARVAAVLEDVPSNSSIQFDFITPYNKSSETVQRWMGDWVNCFSYVYLQAAPGVAEKDINAVINQVVKKHNPGSNGTFFVHPMSKWRLHGDFNAGQNTGGTIEYVRLFSAIAIIVLLIACVNFMNLSTARSAKRAKEVGIRKTLGSGKKELITQFFFESFAVSFIAFIIAVAATLLLLPAFNQLVSKQLRLPVGEPLAWLLAFVIILFTGLVAGSYPALYLSSFKPLRVLKNSFSDGNKVILPRKILVGIQFAISIILISATFIIYRQLQFVKNRDLGYNPDNLVTMNSTADTEKNFDIIKQELEQSGMVASVTRTSAPITDIWNFTPGPEWPGKPANTNFIVAAMGAEEGFSKTFGIKIREGRDFGLTPADSSAMLLNEAAVKMMGLKEPIGMQLRYGNREFTLIGITENVVMASPYAPVEPMMILPRGRFSNFIHIRLNDHVSPQQAVDGFASIFKKYNPAAPFEYNFVDEQFNRKFQSEELIGQLTNLFAGLAIFICCLGLGGLAAFTIQKRVKEIGIRKVLGASVYQLLVLVSKEFLVLVMIAALVAFPLTWWFMNEWLKNYQYRIDISFWLLGIAGTTVMLLAIVIVGISTFRAALANPVKSLRTE